MQEPYDFIARRVNIVIENIHSSGVRTSPRIASDPAELRRGNGFFLRLAAPVVGA